MGMSAAHCQGISECLESGHPVGHIHGVCLVTDAGCTADATGDYNPSPSSSPLPSSSSSAAALLDSAGSSQHERMDADDDDDANIPDSSGSTLDQVNNVSSSLYCLAFLVRLC